jgi:hypothetical protein
MSDQNKKPEVTQGEDRNFFQTWLWDKPIAGYQHITKNLWLYSIVISLLIGGYFFQVLSANVGDWKNALYIILGITFSTAILWLWKNNTLGAVIKHLKKFWYLYLLGLILTFTTLYVFEGAWIHEYLMTAVKNSFVILFVIINFYLVKILYKKETNSWIGTSVVTLFAILLTGGIWYYVVNGGQTFIAKYMKYNSIFERVVEVDQPLESVNERIYPRNVAFLAMNEFINSNVKLTKPDLVKTKNGNMWTSSAVPFKGVTNFKKGGIDKVIYIPADKSFDNMQPTIKDVKFNVGENMIFSRDIYNVAIKKLHGNYFNVFPTNVQYMDDDNSSIVAVVSLSKWSGFLFPSPEFYGVLVVRQEDFSWRQRAVTGIGEIILKKDIPNHKYLVGQNLNSELTTKFIASSFAFEKGFINPLPFIHDDDTVITDMPGENNEFPIVQEAITPEGEIKMFDFYELTPYLGDVHTVSKYVWIPSDGIGPIYTYTPSKHGKVFVSTFVLEKKIKGTRKTYDWSVNRPVEHRPYFKKINGEVQPYFLSSVVVIDKKNNYEKDNVETTLTRVEGTGNKKPIWVDTNKPEDWIKAISH